MKFTWRVEGREVRSVHVIDEVELRYNGRIEAIADRIKQSISAYNSDGLYPALLTIVTTSRSIPWGVISDHLPVPLPETDREEKKIGIGDITCKYNAASNHLRCAINPLGPCEGCSHRTVA